MGIFSKKPNIKDDVFSEYTVAMRAWCERLIAARDTGSDVATVAAITKAVGNVPQLNIQRLSGSVDRDLAIASARAWITMETDRLSRKDVLQGRSDSWWQQVGDFLYLDLPVPSY